MIWMKKKTIIILSVSAIFLLVFAFWMIWGNVAVTVSEYRIESEKLPDAFNGFRIVQVSDLHNEVLGEENSRILEKLEKAAPDIVVLTGDLIDRSKTDVEVAISFAQNACSIAPTYYINGNHENVLTQDEYVVFCDRLSSVGVTVLENESAVIEKNGEYISLVGVIDESFGIVSNEMLLDLKSETADFSILLSHRPKDFSRYAACGYDLVLCGHLHGGQFRLPFLGGLYAPSYGIFPEYDGGMYERDGSVLIVSRGVGNSSFPVRFNNPRELVLVELVRK